MSEETRRGQEVFIYWKRKYGVIQQELEQLQEENCVNRECLKLTIGALEAISALEWEVETKWLQMHVGSALDEIERLLAEPVLRAMVVKCQ